MKIVQINQVSDYGSTGRIVEDISRLMNEQGIQNKILYGFYSTDYPDSIKFNTEAERQKHKILARLTGRHAFFSQTATRQMISFLEDFQPDVIHLHNLHGFYINLPILFHYLHKKQVPVIWTLHDCWPFTGHCSHFDYIGCNKWKTGCNHCPQKCSYPRMIWDASAYNWNAKKTLFTGLSHCVLVTPSQWLASLVSQSFLRDYTVKIIPNGIDLEAFNPMIKPIPQKKTVLAIVPSLSPTSRKGGSYLLQLAEDLGDGYQIVVGGLRQNETMHNAITKIPYITNPQQLAELYATANVFVNPTLEDSFSMINLEALACGTPVVTFNTGGSPSMLSPACGEAVPQGDVKSMARAVRYWANKDCKQACRTQASLFDKNNEYEKYIHLYRTIFESAKKSKENAL